MPPSVSDTILDRVLALQHEEDVVKLLTAGIITEDEAKTLRTMYASGEYESVKLARAMIKEKYKNLNNGKPK